MKRKLPSRRGTYPGPDGTVIPALRDTGWSLWATFGDCVVLLARHKTHEITGTKMVEFRALPDFQLVPDGLVYADPILATASVQCDWSDFLRLTRWRKPMQSLAPSEQARIARLEPMPDSQHLLRLVAVDDPIRHVALEAR